MRGVDKLNVSIGCKKNTRIIVGVCSVLLFTLLGASFAPLMAQNDVVGHAKILFGQKAYAEAIAALEPALKKFPKDPEVNFHYGASLVELQKDLGFAIELLTEASLSKKHVLASYYLAKALHLNYQLPEARMQYQRFKTAATSKMLKDFNVNEAIAQTRVAESI